MTGRERFISLMEHHAADRTGFWLGNPHGDTLPGYLQYFGVSSHLELSVKLQDDFHWLLADSIGWHHPEGKPMFDVLGGQARVSLNQDGVFAGCEDVREVERFDWPDPNFVNLDAVEARIDEARSTGMAIASGAWSCFFHIVADFFGMENYFVKMHEAPEVVEAVTERVVNFYLELNRRIFDRLAGKIDCFFLGNDFGTQLDLLISPNCFRRFVLPSFRRLIDQAKQYHLYVMLHSCGAISKVIPDLIDAGIDALHPIQALARGMDPQSLSAFKEDVVFVGGVDTQHLLPFGTPAEVREAVYRLRDILGPGLIVSPSHEALLPNVKPENLEALYEASVK